MGRIIITRRAVQVDPETGHIAMNLLFEVDTWWFWQMGSSWMLFRGIPQPDGSIYWRNEETGPLSAKDQALLTDHYKHATIR